MGYRLNLVHHKLADSDRDTIDTGVVISDEELEKLLKASESADNPYASILFKLMGENRAAIERAIKGRDGENSDFDLVKWTLPVDDPLNKVIRERLKIDNDNTEG